MACSAIQKAETISSKAGKHLRGLAGYHLQQAAEKMIKIQIYASGIQIDHSKIYRHSLDDLMSYANSQGISLLVPSWVNEKKYFTLYSLSGSITQSTPTTESVDN